MTISDVAGWLAKEVVAPELAATLAARLAKRPARKRLTAAVRSEAGKPGKAYRRWLKDSTTWKLLEKQSVDAYDGLVDSLMDAQVRFDGASDFDRADQLVVLTIVNFLTVLDPSMAVSIHDLRSEGRHWEGERRAAERHGELMAQLTPEDEMERRRRQLPPRARRTLADDVERDIQAQLLSDLERSSPTALVHELVRVPPSWFVESNGAVLLVAAELAAGHEMHDEAGQWFAAAGDQGGVDRQGAYVHAAYEYMAAGRRDLADNYIAKALALGTCPEAKALARMGEGPAAILLELPDRDARVSPLGTLLRAEALVDEGDHNGAAALLQDRHAEWADDDRIALALAQVLLARSLQPHAVDSRQDRQRASELLLDVRDARREWAGDSAVAVEVACDLFMAIGDADAVLRIGRVPPDGEARMEEAASPEVGFAVAQCALERGDISTARAIAQSASGFEGTMLLADVAAASGAPRSEVVELYERGWDLATEERQKRVFWIGASQLGIDPLPGEDELDSYPDMALIVRATNLTSLGRTNEAVTMLRPDPSRSARQALVHTYLAADQLDDAIDELKAMATRFGDAGYLVVAVKELLKRDRVVDARDLSIQALAVLPHLHDDRGLLFGVCMHVAAERADWPDLERWARGALREPSHGTRPQWALVWALFNQARPDAAWEALHTDGPHEVENAVDAQLWIQLTMQFDPSPDSLTRALDLAERFEEADVRMAATNAYFTHQELCGDSSDGEHERWARQVKLREERPGERDSFHSFQVSDDPEELTERFRSLLQPQAQVVEDAIRHVARDGFPIGVVAYAAGRPYSLTLISRPLGFCPIGSPSPESFEQEVAAAIAALDEAVVADLSSLITGYYVQALWPRCVGSFSRIDLPAEARRDLIAEATKPKTDSAGTLGWDLASDRPILHEADPVAEERVSNHLEWAAAQIEIMHACSAPAGDDDVRTSWGDAVALAAASGHALWADDAGLRIMATASGVRSFGTHALLEALEQQGRVPSGTAASALESLRNEYCVDLPLDPRWLSSSAEIDQYEGGPALVTFSRRATWHDLRKALEAWQSIVDSAAAVNPLLVARWVYAAAIGVLHLTADRIDAGDPLPASDLVGRLAVAAILAGREPEATSAILESASAACATEGIPDPTAQVLRMLSDVLVGQLGERDGKRNLALLCQQVGDPYRELLQQVLFGHDSDGP